jgi:sugar lactone lactonase YvrE
VSPIIISGLSNGAAYTFTVTATNSVGASLASAASNSATPAIALTVPGAPIIGTATAGNAQASISFTAPASNGGAAITSYTVTASTGGLTATGTVSPIIISGLSNGTAYTFTVTATNSVGASLASAASNSATPVAAGITVSTLAGSTVGNVDATGAAAKFSNPRGVTVDSSGNVYIADYTNAAIRKITAAGVVTTLVLTDGDGTGTTFNTPVGVTVDTSGNLYVADQWHQMIKKITAAGVMTTLAGSAWTTGSADGTGAAASFNAPTGIVVDSATGNVYVAEIGSTPNHIRKITSAGVVTTVASGFNVVSGIAIDSIGNLFVADKQNCAIKKITQAGVVTTFAGGVALWGNVDGTGTAASFSGPEGITIDSFNNIFVADTLNNSIRKITPAGVVTTVAGAGTAGALNGSAASATFHGPTGVAVDSAGVLYIADDLNHLIRKIQ